MLDELIVEEHVKNIENNGFTIIEDVLSSDECKTISKKLDTLDAKDRAKYGVDKLLKINEIGIIRALMNEDEFFINLILHPKIYPIISRIIGDTGIIHLQNAIIVYPETKHGQSYFHRDFAKDFLCTKPISINAIWMIDEFTNETGATWVVPGTHKIVDDITDQELEKRAIQAEGKAGSVMIFDSMLIHRGGSNRSNKIRRAINHQYTRPFIKQQIDLPQLLRDKFDKKNKIGQVLGFWSIPPKSVDEFRCDPEKRTYRSGQG